MAITKSGGKSFEIKAQRTPDANKNETSVKTSPKTEPQNNRTADKSVFESKSAELKTEANYRKFQLNQNLRTRNKPNSDVRTAQPSQVTAVSKVTSGEVLDACEEIRSAQYRVEAARAEVERVVKARGTKR